MHALYESVYMVHMPWLLTIVWKGLFLDFALTCCRQNSYHCHGQMDMIAGHYNKNEYLFK